MTTIGNNIKNLRKAQGLTQEQVSAAIGISRELLGLYETNRTVPVKYLQSFADLFNVDIEQLLEENPQEMELITSFRTLEHGQEDITQLVTFRRVVKNYLKLKHLSDE